MLSLIRHGTVLGVDLWFSWVFGIYIATLFSSIFHDLGVDFDFAYLEPLSTSDLFILQCHNLESQIPPTAGLKFRPVNNVFSADLSSRIPNIDLIYKVSTKKRRALSQYEMISFVRRGWSVSYLLDCI